MQCDSLIKANETNPNFIVPDARTPGEWNSGHILGSTNRSSGLLDMAELASTFMKFYYKRIEQDHPSKVISADDKAFLLMMNCFAVKI